MDNKRFFIVFVSFWIILIVLNFIIPNKEFSQNENRMLAKVPKFKIEDLIDGEYVDKLNDYINDHFVFRDIWLKINATEELILGKSENNGVYIGKDGYLFEKITYTNESQEKINNLVQSINNFYENTNITTYFLLIPTSTYIYQEKLPRFAETINQQELIDSIYNMSKNIKVINVTNVLKENKEKNIFFKTDHHFTTEGAYLTYLEFCKIANIKPITEYAKEQVSDSFLGSFDSKAQIINQEKDKIEVYKNSNNTEGLTVDYDKETTNSIFNEDFLKQKDKYSYFLNGNNAKVVVKTNQKNGKKLLVIKDSFAHIMAQFFCQNYEEIHFIDPRYYTYSIEEYAKQNQISETLFLFNVSSVI